MRLIRTALAVCVVVLAATAAFAQSGGMKIVVIDGEGLPLPGATVTLSHATGSVKTHAEMTDKDGVVEFPVLRAGSGYAIQVSFPGFAPIRYDDLRVQINSTLPMQIQMVEEFEERVKVVATRDVIDLEKNESSTRFSDSFISDLPVPGRMYQNVLTMAPGVQDADGDGNPNVHGSRARDFQTTVGGVSNVDPLTGQWLSRINPNSIEEMEVITSGAGVEFGRAQGGYARIIQKQGSNTHEGEFEFYFQTSKLDGDGAGDYSDLPDSDFETIAPAFQFTGPLIKDKLWYRASYTREDLEDPRNVLSGIETYNRLTETIDAQVTWQASPRNKLAFSFRSDPYEDSNFGLSNTRGPDSTLSLKRDVETFQLVWTAPYSPRILVDTTVAWQDVNDFDGPTTADIPNDCLPNAPQDFLREAYCNNLSENTVTGSWFRTRDDHKQRLTVKGQATVYGGKFWGMTHQFKLGLNVENERYFREMELKPRVTFFVVNVPQDDEGNPDEETTPESFGVAIAQLSVPQTDDVRATSGNWGIYAEDQFKPAQNLTITLGARVDREEITSEGREAMDPSAELKAYEDHLLEWVPGSSTVNPLTSQDNPLRGDWEEYFTGYEDFASFQSQLQGIICSDVGADSVGNCFTDVAETILQQNQTGLNTKRRAEDIYIQNTNFSPFLSVAWSPWSNGKTAFRMSAGRHYNNIPLTVPLRELEPVSTTTEFRVSLADPDSCPPPDPDEEDPLPCGGTQLRGGIEPTLTIQSLDRDLKTPYQDEFSLKVERELWAETSISLEYLNRKYRDQLQTRNINVATNDYGRCVFQDSLDDPTVMSAPGMSASFEEDTGDWLFDPVTREYYPDTDPGFGDGRLDDCAGEWLQIGLEECEEGDPFCNSSVAVQRPDGIDDLYLQNPFWGDIIQVGNFNESDYKAFILELVRRQYRGWELQSSYTWSESKGDGEDFTNRLGLDPSLREQEYGYQSQDQRHVVKVNATTITPWGIRLGTSVSWQSGLPYSVLTEQVSIDIVSPSTRSFASYGARPRQRYPSGVRNDERNKSYWNVDLRATKEFRLGRRLNLQLLANVFNLLDDGTYIIYNTDSELGQQVNGRNEAYRRFGRSWELGMKATF